jgi:hypothetical protein
LPESRKQATTKLTNINESRNAGSTLADLVQNQIGACAGLREAHSSNSPVNINNAKE